MTIENFLKENKISQRKFAKEVGISNTYLHDLIKGDSYMSKKTMKLIKDKYPDIDICVGRVEKFYSFS